MFVYIRTQYLQLDLYVDENRTKVLIYNPLSSKINISELEWKGVWITKLCSNMIMSFFIDGEAPRDAPIPVVLTSSLTEHVIIGVVSSIGVISAIFFFVFNLYYNNHT